MSVQEDGDKGFGKYSNNLIASTNNLNMSDKNDNWPPKQQDVFNMAGLLLNKNIWSIKHYKT